MFDYQNHGDLLYSREEYCFRYKGQNSAEIKVLNINCGTDYVIEAEILHDYIPAEERTFSESGFKQKNEALQYTINKIGEIIEKHKDKDIMNVKLL